MRGENWRFWFPVVLLLLFAGYSSQKLVRAHINPDVDDIDYTFERDLPGCRGSIYGSLGKSYPLAKSVPLWEYRLDPVALTNCVVKPKGAPPRTRGEISDTIAEALGLDRVKVRKMVYNTANRYQFLAMSSDPVAHKTLCDSRLVAGVKIDFMDHSDQWMVNFYERVARECAKNKLLIDYHGAFKPAGLEQRLPNLISYEGVRGLEQCGGCTPENSIWLPFIRNVVGAMDFTPGAMHNAQPEDNLGTGSLPMGAGTRAYQMALYVCFESGLQMLADSPSRYLREDECTRYMNRVYRHRNPKEPFPKDRPELL